MRGGSSADPRFIRPRSEFTPAYLSTWESGLLAEKVEEALEELRVCRVCPRDCDVDRLAGERAICKTGRWARVASAFPHHADKALAAAAEIQDLLRDREFAGVHLPTRIGINTGEVVAGNVGSGDRFNYTIHGDAVNVAARLEQLNKELGTRVLISASTVAQLTDRSRIRAIGETQIRGKSAPMEIYTLA